MQIKISILSVETTTPAGKKYKIANVSYKDLGQGKVASKNIFSFGAQEGAFKALADAKHGEVFSVEMDKNDKGYWDWISVSQDAPGATPAVSTVEQKAVAVKSNWQGETPEERKAKQVYIVKQSSISAAIALLTTGAKIPPSTELIISEAQKFVDYVFGVNDKPLGALVDVPNDLDEVE